MNKCFLLQREAARSTPHSMDKIMEHPRIRMRGAADPWEIGFFTTEERMIAKPR
jgi:hypothetical protein